MIKTEVDFKILDSIKEENYPLLIERLKQEPDKYIIDENGIRLKGEFFEKQTRIALKNFGIVDEHSVKEYVALGGYYALAKVISSYTPEEVVNEMKNSGLRGRGGAGFPTGRKWEGAMQQPPGQKYVVCNADEGDPGAFMDRSILEGDPHSVLEGMAICGYAIGADRGFIYVRAEYPKAVINLREAIKKAEDENLLGDNIMGTDFSFHVELRLGAGAFVCGEGTALIESIEGKRGMPRTKVYRTTVKGLFQKPTVLNNVETFANVPQIMYKGSDWYRSIGTEDSSGTKVFALVGKVANAGLVEVPMGTTINEIVYDIGGGTGNDKKVKAVQTGGPSGGCIPTDYFDTPVDFGSLAKIGSIMGSGGMVVMDETDCMVDIARFFLDFTVEESCGKCVPCREGTKRMLELLEKITSGKGEDGDIERLEDLSETITVASLCGLGQTAANPVVSTLHYFRNEYEAHIYDKKCPAGVCQALLEFFITDKCVGCTKCAKACPVDCITGVQKELHVIDPSKCIKCGSCEAACPVNAIIRR